MKAIHFIITITVFVFYSCIEYDYDFDAYEEKVVVDGWIENGKFPKVLLTKSAGYFSEIDSASIRAYVLTQARVEVSDGKNSEVLTLKPNYDYFPPFVYEGSKIKGEAGKTYHLKVNYNKKEITAKTTIPAPAIIEECYFKLDDGYDSLGFIWVSFTDNPLTRNYYRTLTKVKSKDRKFIASYIPNFKDDYFNGETIEMSIYQGNTSSLNKHDQIYYKIGDTIQLKLTTIDKASFDFWNTFQREIFNAGNPFASTNSRVISNINNGLGVWCGYGSSYQQIIAK